MTVIAVYGSASPKEGEPDYESAYRLGYLLGQAGYEVMTGGYGGTMEAVSRGAMEAGAPTIGVTCAEIERYRPQEPNPWVKKVEHTETLIDRLRVLMDKADAAIALPGGVGTLLEISLSWNLRVIHAVPPQPLILVGQGWQQTFETLLEAQGQYISSQAREFLRFVPNGDAALATLLAVLPPDADEA